jgi:penicillin-binding protein 1B
LLLYGRHLSVRIDERFSARRWRIPSKVFADTTLLFPGQRFKRDLLLDKLFDLGYQEVLRRPEKKGEMQIGPTEIGIYLHDLKTPWKERAGFVVRLTTGKNIITSIVRADTAEIVPILELEPEEISLFFGPERERRQLVSIQQVPRHLIFAVMAIEDARFYQHHGIDLLGISRAFLMNVRHGAIRQGGSTLTQQLANTGKDPSSKTQRNSSRRGHGIEISKRRNSRDLSE